MYTLIINYTSREKRYALVNNSMIEKLVIQQPQQQSAVGTIYLGTVEKVLPGMNAAFINIGEEKSGYLHRDKLASFVQAQKDKNIKEMKSVSSYVHQGEKLLVQVEKDATGAKGPRLTGIIELQGTHMIYMPQGRYVAVSKKIEEQDLREELRQFGHEAKKQEEGLIFRTTSRNQPKEKLLDELEQLREKSKELQITAGSLKKPGKVLERDSMIEEIIEVMERLEISEILVDDLALKHELQVHCDIPIVHYNGKENIFSVYKLEHEIEKALKRIVWLDNGAYLIFDEAEALTVIDVNTGKYIGKHDLAETAVKTNEWAAAEAARQIRLRDIAGMILIDFIDMKEEKDRNRIASLMAQELRKDDRRTNIVGFTPLGIMQITRKRIKPAISEALMVKCPTCDGKGRVLSPETVAFRLERELWEHRGSDYAAVLIEATEDVQALFSGEQNVHKQRLEELMGLEIIFSIKLSPKPEYEIRQFGTSEEIRRKARI
ncbi:Rne/Rng family ribonuclease [Bacillus sp. S/N-304-OC-R1]|uniref:Rne/Rng family ribonuclease n=1 Tax=Bacillus sp. S/N-304-OC-R1 TaxID=2758034 RepID=UPI001C8DF498|nr:Rne/Rng family ribonuclease [Bacillus sp. S/N-304-OC-R1]MBY0123948.1 Rne/Rng family ribonuclease [Bacillus sp. S/N-304-OC-R1]